MRRRVPIVDPPPLGSRGRIVWDGQGRVPYYLSHEKATVVGYTRYSLVVQPDCSTVPIRISPFQWWADKQGEETG